jgi:hypothetical protein
MWRVRYQELSHCGVHPDGEVFQAPLCGLHHGLNCLRDLELVGLKETQFVGDVKEVVDFDFVACQGVLEVGQGLVLHLVVRQSALEDLAPLLFGFFGAGHQHFLACVEGGLPWGK